MHLSRVSFCSRSICTAETSRTSFELLVSCFLLKTLALSSWSWAVPEVRAFLMKTPADDFVSPSANCTRVGTHISPDRFWSLPLLPNAFLTDATVNAVPRSSGTLASLAKHSNKLPQSVITRMAKCSSLHSSGKTLHPITASHNNALVYSASSRASRRALDSAPKVDRIVRFETLLFQVMKDVGMASVFSTPP